MKFRFRLTQLAINLSLVGVLTVAVATLAYFAAAYTVDDLSAQVLEQSLLRVDRQARFLLETAEDQTNLCLALSGHLQMTAADFPQLVPLMTSLLSSGSEATSIFIGLEATGECIGVFRDTPNTFAVWELTRRSSPFFFRATQFFGLPAKFFRSYRRCISSFSPLSSIPLGPQLRIVSILFFLS